MVDMNKVNFWFRMFEPRTKKYQRETLRELKRGKNPFETEEQRQDKIRALEVLLKKR